MEVIGNAQTLPDNIKCTETQTESAVHFSFYSDQMRRR